MGNNSVPKFIFRLSRFSVYRGSVLGRFYCIYIYIYIYIYMSYSSANLQTLYFKYVFIQQIYIQNILNMLHNLRFFSLQNAVYFIMLPCLVPVLFAFYLQVCKNLNVKFRLQKVARFVVRYLGGSSPLCVLTSI